MKKGPRLSRVEDGCDYEGCCRHGLCLGDKVCVLWGVNSCGGRQALNGAGSSQRDRLNWHSLGDLVSLLMMPGYFDG